MPGQTASGFPYILATDPVINAPDTWEALALRLEQEDDSVDVAIGNLKPKEHSHPDPDLGIRQQYVALTATKGQSGYPGAITIGSGDGYVRLQPEGDGYITVEEDGVGLFSVYANAEGSAGLPSGTYLRFRFTREEFNGKPQDHTGYLDVEIKAGHNVITAHNWQITTEAGRKYSVWVDVRREGGAASGSVTIESRQFKMHNIIVGVAAEVGPPALEAPTQVFATVKDAEWFANGVHGALPAEMPCAFNLDGLGDISGMPVAVVVMIGGYARVEAPVGWTERMQWKPGSWQSFAVFTVDSYSGQSFSGFRVTQPVSDRGNSRLFCWVLAAKTPGRWRAKPGTWDPVNLVVPTPPGGEYRLQFVGTGVRYDRGWTPPLPAGIGGFGGIWQSMFVNGAMWSGWSTDQAQIGAAMRDQALLQGTYVPGADGDCSPFTVYWGDAPA